MSADHYAADKAERESHVQSALKRQSRIIDDIFTAIDNIEHRFDRVLRPEPPTKEPERPRVAEVLAPLATDLSVINERLDAAHALLIRLRDRCEI